MMEKGTYKVRCVEQTPLFTEWEEYTAEKTDDGWIFDFGLSDGTKLCIKENWFLKHFKIEEKMKAIDINRKCAECDHETDRCVKLSDPKTGNDVCYDTNEVIPEGKEGELIEDLATLTIGAVKGLIKWRRTAWLLGGLLAAAVVAIILLLVL